MQKHYNQLKEEFGKMKVPEGLEHLEKAHRADEATEDTKPDQPCADATPNGPATLSPQHNGPTTDNQTEDATDIGPECSGGASAGVGVGAETQKQESTVESSGATGGVKDGLVGSQLNCTQDTNSNNAYEFTSSAKC